MNIEHFLDWEKYKGIFVVPDVHSNYQSFLKATEYAKTHRYFIVMLGDLVDSFSQPLECIELAADIILEQEGCLCIGNHEHKHIRKSIGSDVLLSVSGKETLNIVKDKLNHFNEVLNTISEKGKLFISFKSLFFCHAAVHPTYWQTKLINKKTKEFFLYGEVSKEERDEDGYRLRTHEWVYSIPEGITVVAGHDRIALSKSKYCPVSFSNLNSGSVYFLDSSSGKDSKGVLSCAIFAIDTCEFLGYKFF